MGAHTVNSPSQTNEVNWNDPLNKGLVGWWRTSKGNLLEDVAGQFNAKVTDGGQGWNPETRSSAVLCNGTSSTADLGYVPPAGYGDWTIGLWVQTDSPSAYQAAVGRDSGSSTRDFVFGCYLGKWVFISRLATGGEIFYGSIVPDTGWHHLLFTRYFTGSKRIGEIYVDGNLDATDQTFGYYFADTTNPFLGSRDFAAPYGQFWDGQLSDLRWYDRRLSPSEVHDLYVASRTGYRDQFKRRYFPVGISIEEPPTEETAGGLIRLKRP
jgi:hypothetical protein